VDFGDNRLNRETALLFVFLIFRDRCYCYLCKCLGALVWLGMCPFREDCDFAIESAFPKKTELPCIVLRPVQFRLYETVIARNMEITVGAK